MGPLYIYSYPGHYSELIKSHSKNKMVPNLIDIEYNSQKSNILKGINHFGANDPYVSQKYFDRFSGNKFK